MWRNIPEFLSPFFAWKHFRVHWVDSFPRRINKMSHKNGEVSRPESMNEIEKDLWEYIRRSLKGNLYSRISNFQDQNYLSACPVWKWASVLKMLNSIMLINDNQFHADQNRRMKWKKENKSKVEGGEGLDESPEPPSQWSEVTLFLKIISSHQQPIFRGDFFLKIFSSHQ